MSRVPADPAIPIREFDHHDCPGITTDPFIAYERFRGDRIFWSTRHGGFWVLTRYADIRAVLSDAITFSNRTGSIPPAGWPRPLIPEELDPPDHGAYRTLVARCLAGNAGRGIVAAVRRECVQLAEQLAPRGTCDLVTDYSHPIQHALFVTLFAVPRFHAAPCAAWVADLLQHRDPTRRLRAVAAIKDYLTARITDPEGARRRGSAPGLLGALAEARIDGRALNGEEILDIAFLMVMASLDTLANSLNLSFRYLAQHPDRRRQLTTQLANGDRAAEELLRLHSVVNIARTATRDTTVADTPVKKGDRVLLCLSLAGRDPDVYPRLATAAAGRPVNPGHLAFGAGPHRCLGARIATGAFTAALREWHHRIPAYTIPVGTDLHTGGGAVCSLDALPPGWST